ncbi:hypothetical protein D3C78_1018950 [compost metagenome]
MSAAASGKDPPLIFLCLDHPWIIVFGVRRESHVAQTVTLGCQALGHCSCGDQLAEGHFLLGQGLGSLQFDQQIAGTHTVAIADMQRLDDAALEMLNCLAVVLDDDHARCQSRAVERGKGCP